MGLVSNQVFPPAVGALKMYRLFSMGVVLMWVSAMSALFVRDVWPAWTAQNPPPMSQDQFAGLHDLTEQLKIVSSEGRRLGTSWTNILAMGGNTAIQGTVLLDGITAIPSILIESVTEFDAAGGLDSLMVSVHGVPMTRIQIRGERRGISFPCVMQFGTIHRQASLDLAATRLIGQTLRPFSFLPKVEVGQSWRMQLFDPLSMVGGRRNTFNSVVARVTGREAVEDPLVPGESVECYIVETSPNPSKAWIRPDGRVLRQQANMPGFGSVIVEQEPYEEEARESARLRIGGPRKPGESPSLQGEADQVTGGTGRVDRH